MRLERAQGRSTRFVRAVAWEFVQNLPLIGGFVLGLDLWQRGRVALAVACMVGGSVLGALLIRATESKIVEGHDEPFRVVVTNAVVIVALMLIVAAYLAAPWSRWWMDLLFGLLGGVLLGVVQDWAGGTPVGLGHCLAMGLAIPLVLLALRLLSATLPAVANVFVVTVAVTVVIALVDYGPWRVGPGEA